jgi:hypothetical protein
LIVSHWKRQGRKKRFGPGSLEGVTVAADGMASDIHGSAESRAHLIGVLAAIGLDRRRGRPRSDNSQLLLRLRDTIRRKSPANLQQDSRQTAARLRALPPLCDYSI